MGLSYLVVNMQSVYLICLAVVYVLAFENANADRNNGYYYRSYSNNQRPVLLISSSGSRSVYVPPEADDNTPFENGDVEKVSLAVYYATDCPDSMRFITRQVYPLYQEMGDIVDIELIPYGKTRESYDEEKNKYSFRCQHGSSECIGNTVQSCAISLYPETKDHLAFISCMELYPRPSSNGRKCARRTSLNWEQINKCARGEEGIRLQHEMALKTNSLNPKLHFIPWVVVDKVFNESNQLNAQRNLKGVICNAYKGNHPRCQQ